MESDKDSINTSNKEIKLSIKSTIISCINWFFIYILDNNEPEQVKIDESHGENNNLFNSQTHIKGWYLIYNYLIFSNIENEQINFEEKKTTSIKLNSVILTYSFTNWLKIIGSYHKSYWSRSEGRQNVNYLCHLCY